MSRIISSIVLGALLLPILRVAAEGETYCGSGAQPPTNDCDAAINKIDGSQSYQSASFMAGSCTVAVNPIGVDSNAPWISGNTFRSEAWGIINSCGTDGFCTDSGLNVTVQQCLDCMYGVCAVCSAPYREVKPRAKPTRMLTEKTVEKRSGAPGVSCLSAFSVASQDCYDLASTLAGQEISLPYTAASGNCELAIEPHSRGQTVMGYFIDGQINGDVQVCQTDGVVGTIVDTSSSQYTIYFGNLCNQFGFGTANCCPEC